MTMKIELAQLLTNTTPHDAASILTPDAAGEYRGNRIADNRVDDA
ncbi:hypothetical protein [Nocardia veterana]|nr:hypothetical protein [Nocardia veterana]